MALPAAGNRITADLLAQLTNNSLQFIGAAQTTGSQGMTTTAADLTGTSLTFTTTYPNTKVTIWACYDIDMGGAASGIIFIGTCLVDGAGQAGEAHQTVVRSTCFQEWITTLSASGSHTIKLQGKSTGGTAGSTQGTHTKWHALVFGP
jgi:hypothetical protein